MALGGSIGGNLEIRRTDVELIQAPQGGVFENCFLVDITGNGEGIDHIDFNVRFVELPIFHPGWHMAPNQRLTKGNFPAISVGVFTWKMGVRPDTGSQFFDGATVCIKVLSGPPDLSATLHLSFRGKALRAPAGVVST